MQNLRRDAWSSHDVTRRIPERVADFLRVLEVRRRADGEREDCQALLGRLRRLRLYRGNHDQSAVRQWHRGRGRCGKRGDTDRTLRRLGTIIVMMHGKCSGRPEDQQQAQPRTPSRERPHTFTYITESNPESADANECVVRMEAQMQGCRREMHARWYSVGLCSSRTVTRRFC